MDLSEIEPAWQGFKLNRTGLWIPEGLHYTPNTLRAEWWNRQIIRDLRKRLREPQQYSLFDIYDPG